MIGYQTDVGKVCQVQYLTRTLGSCPVGMHYDGSEIMSLMRVGVEFS